MPHEHMHRVRDSIAELPNLACAGQELAGSHTCENRCGGQASYP